MHKNWWENYYPSHVANKKLPQIIGNCVVTVAEFHIESDGIQFSKYSPIKIPPWYISNPILLSKQKASKAIFLDLQF